MQNVNMVVGEVVHSAIEKFWEGGAIGEKFIESELMYRLGNNRPALKHAKECYYVYTNYFRQYLLPDDKIEMGFKIPISSDVFLVGKLDRVSGGNVFDWKTSKDVPTDVSNDIQFIIYNWAYKRLTNSSASGVYYASLSSGNLIKYNFNQLYYDVLFNDIIPQAIKVIKSKDFVRNGVFRKQCYWCQYKIACRNDTESGEKYVMDSSTST